MLTVRDFTQIFDAYAEFSESVISALMASLEEGDDDDVAETEAELDERMKTFEELMDRRPFLVNEVLLRRNPNDVQEWEKRILLWRDNDDKVRYLRMAVALRTQSWNPYVDAGCRNIHQRDHYHQPAQGYAQFPQFVR